MTTWASSCAWDAGIQWFSRRTVAPTDLPVQVDYIRDQVLRVLNGDREDEFIESVIRGVTADAEHHTQRALMPQTWQMVLSGFPASGQIVLERPPLIEVTSVAYYDGDNDLQELVGSPSTIDVVASGAYAKAIVRVASGSSFPSSSTRPDAVIVTYRAGYTDEQDPELMLIKHGIALTVGELYKIRSLSVQEPNNTPAALQVDRFWRRVW